ncbi:HEPN domain-containing protein [Ammonifex degensii]|uniref:HEPN domain-containing protein n=1 Tax=Ammonifex degensii TaxID=42838 RepID=UPI000674A1D0|nr:HEPN domain-containing protein [Ammonifex degensii]
MAELASLASKLERSFKEVRRQAAALDKYYIPTRYPNGLPGGIPAEAFDEADGQRALELARLVIDFVSERLKG